MVWRPLGGKDFSSPCSGIIGGSDLRGVDPAGKDFSRDYCIYQGKCG